MDKRQDNTITQSNSITITHTNHTRKYKQFANTNTITHNKTQVNIKNTSNY